MKTVKLLIKILLSVGLLTYLILSAEIERIIDVLGNIWQEGRTQEGHPVSCISGFSDK